MEENTMEMNVCEVKQEINEGDNQLHYGTVIFFKNNKKGTAPSGFGFIKQEKDTEKDIFFHYSDLQMENYKFAKSGQRVSYKIGSNKNGLPKAVEITVVQ